MDITFFILGNFLEEMKTWVWFLLMGSISGAFILLTHRDDNNGR